MTTRPSPRQTDDTPLPLALTMGDPAGIGPEITLKAWAAQHATPTDDLHGHAPFAVLGPAELYRELAARLGLEVPVHIIADVCEAAGVFPGALPVLDIPLAAPVEPGKADTAHAHAVTASIETAARLADQGRVLGIVTNPITKAMLYAAGFSHPGHTEYLASLAGRFSGAPAPLPVMMLASPALRVVPLTIHEPLARVPSLITREMILSTLQVMDTALKQDFGIASPRIAVAGLNPHAGESGTIGREEIGIITPALEEARAQGLTLIGPLSADTMFHGPARARYDAALCMYHDQALIPIKTLDFENGVNVTLGLPFVRTSPDHGTAHDIAGTGEASALNLQAAIAMAAQMGRRRIARRAFGNAPA